jgi:hypothetical protein
MSGNCIRIDIETALLAEGGIARDDRFSDLKSGHVVFNDFIGVGQRPRQLCTQLAQDGAKLFWSGLYVGVVTILLPHDGSLPFCNGR